MNRNTIVSPIKNPHSVSKPIDQLAIRPRLRRIVQLHQSALDELLIGAGAYTVFHHTRPVNDARQPPGHGADHACHGRQKEHGATANCTLCVTLEG